MLNKLYSIVQHLA